ncbi:MAG TPA: cytochrome d ubiquinol oxidase subunit II [Ktedonobacteraceae bacterium]|nr:cytochrome d ubiquinol oxidase subunit II [Ktedonobacteraceae bacterium]
MNLIKLVTFLLWFVLIVYIILGGTALGMATWELFPPKEQGAQYRLFIHKAIGPTWEASHLLLIYLPFGLFLAYPFVYSVLSTVFLVPAILILVAIVLRVIALILLSINAMLSRLLRLVSLLALFLLGTIAGVIASGQIIFQQDQLVPVNLWNSYVIPFAVVMGAFVVALCSLQACLYLLVRAEEAENDTLIAALRSRSLIAVAVTTILALVGLILARADVPILWHGMIKQGIFLLVVTTFFWLWMVWSLFQEAYHRARNLMIIETALLLLWWGASQTPYLIPPHITIDYATVGPYNVLIALLIGSIIGLVCLFLAIRYHSHIFKSRGSEPSM